VNFPEQDARAWTELSWLRIGSSGVLGNETSGSMKCGELIKKKNWGKYACQGLCCMELASLISLSVI